MLRKPSEIIAMFPGIKSLRDYGFLIYRRLLIAVDNPGKVETALYFSQSFYNEQNALSCVKNVRKIIDTNVPKENDNEVELFLLPPAFIRTNAEVALEINSKLMLIFLKEGPVVPVVFQKTKEKIQGDEKFLNALLAVYTATSESYVNLTNVGSLLNITT